MIIYCPSCKRETLLTKCGICSTNWKCDFCNECCLSKEGVPFQNETIVEEDKITPEEEHKLYEKAFAPTKEVKKVERRRQMTIFDVIKNDKNRKTE